MAVYLNQFSLGGNGRSVAIKDCIDIAGMVTTSGSAVFASSDPALVNADVVDRLIDAGCHITGKLNMHEFAYGMSGVNNWSGTPVNFIHPNYIPGGSSCGSAVCVAQGDVDFTLGTDTGGSIRLPAACCGVFGLKPTFGRVSRKGLSPVYSTLDCVGPFAKTASLISEAMTILDADFKRLSGDTDFTIGIIDVEVSKEVESVFLRAIQSIATDIPSCRLPLMNDAFDAGMTIINAETWNSFGQYVDCEGVGDDVCNRLRKAQKTDALQLAEAEKIRVSFTREVDKLLQKFDILLLPTLPSLPMSREDGLAGKIDLKLSSLVRPFNLSGHPALSMPIENSNNWPIGLQLIAAKGKDELLCYAAEQISSMITKQ